MLLSEKKWKHFILFIYLLSIQVCIFFVNIPSSCFFAVYYKIIAWYKKEIALFCKACYNKSDSDKNNT